VNTAHAASEFTASDDVLAVANVHAVPPGDVMAPVSDRFVDANELVIVIVDGTTVVVLAPRFTDPRFRFVFVVVTITPYPAFGVIVTVNWSIVVIARALVAVSASASKASAAALHLLSVFMCFSFCCPTF
jgi:hypothetical protein